MDWPAGTCPQRRSSRPSRSEIIGHAEHLRLSLITDLPSVVEFSGSPAVVISIHVGPSVDIDCRRGGERHSARTVHGDIEIIPPALSGVWEFKGSGTTLVIGLGLTLIHRVIEELGSDPARFEVRNRFQERDPRIEHIGWALKAEMEHGYPCGRVYLDSLATGLAAAVVQNHSSFTRPSQEPNCAMSVRTLRHVLAYIDDNLDQALSLHQLAAVGGLSVSHLKAQFRKAVGLSAHQYLIRRRVDRAATLLRSARLPIGRVALETGFCHQSHLAMHMRRVLGVTPQEVRNGRGGPARSAPGWPNMRDERAARS
jgi:AraC family transcriptional regulator